MNKNLNNFCSACGRWRQACVCHYVDTDTSGGVTTTPIPIYVDPRIADVRMCPKCKTVNWDRLGGIMNNRYGLISSSFKIWPLKRAVQDHELRAADWHSYERGARKRLKVIIIVAIVSVCLLIGWCNYKQKQLDNPVSIGIGDKGGWRK